MKFTVVRNKIICSRKKNTVVSDDSFVRVVEFDAHVATVPPHVLSMLTPSEITELESFFVDRLSIQANPANKNLLEALPGLLREASQILQSVDHINSTIFEELTASVAEISVALEQVKTAGKDSPTQTDNMRESEAQKERLEDIKLNF